MEIKSVSNVLKNLGGLISKNSPTILTGVAVAGVFTTIVFAVKATPKAYLICENAEQEKNEQLTKKEVVQLTWKCYIPTAIMGSITIGCIVGANHISFRRNAALASLYSLTEAAFKEYQGKVVETIGQKKEIKMAEEIACNKMTANPPGKNEVIFTGKGNHLCYDSLSGRRFKSDIEKIRQAVNGLNEQLRDDMFISLNDFYYALGLSNIELGDLMGWHMDNGWIKVSYSSCLTEDGEPCIVLNYQTNPRYS